LNITLKFIPMTDYLRARIEALETEVHRLEKKCEFNTAQLEIAKQHFGFNYFTNSTLEAKQ